MPDPILYTHVVKNGPFGVASPIDRIADRLTPSSPSPVEKPSAPVRLLQTIQQTLLRMIRSIPVPSLSQITKRKTPGSTP